MAPTVRDVLARNLENLGKKGFKKFKIKLNEADVDPQYNKIPRGRLEEADEDEVVSLIKNFYTDGYGVQVTLQVLEAIDENEAAEAIRSDLKKVKGFRLAQEQAEDEAEAAAPEMFMDRHRSALISRMTLVTPVLDELLSMKLLTHEQYETVRDKRPSQEQMRELYLYARAWGHSDKIKFYHILKVQNGPLVRDLEGS
ncbi:apoptosis-associated speck-like protein containing a CARD [Pelodytes ibericus]